MKLSAAQRSFIRRRTTEGSDDPSLSVGELNIVPFLDIVVNMIVFMLVVASSVMAVAQVYAQLPTHGPHRPRQALDLSLILTDHGMVLAGSGGKLAPGCETTASGAVMTVPSVGGAYDFTSLHACAVRVKRSYPEESEITISAEPTVAYEDVVRAMDAVRNEGGEPLFPDVRLSAGVR